MLLLEAPGRVVPVAAGDPDSDATERAWLTPILPMGVERLVGVGDGAGVTCMRRRVGIAAACACGSPDDGAGPAAGTPARRSVQAATRSASAVTVLTHDADDWVVLDTSTTGSIRRDANGGPAKRALMRCGSLPFRGGTHRLCSNWWGLTENGAVRAAEFYVDGGSLQLIASRVATNEAGYVGAAHAGSNTVVAVSPLGIDWLSFHGDRFRLSHKWQRANLDFSSAVACFATHSARCAWWYCSRGLVMRVPLPPRGSGGKRQLTGLPRMMPAVAAPDGIGGRLNWST